MYENLADKLKSARIRSGYRLAQVTELVGISYAVLAHYEVGERIPSLTVLAKLAKLYKISTDYLLDITPPAGNLITLDGLNEKQKQIIKDTISSFRNTKSL